MEGIVFKSLLIGHSSAGKKQFMSKYLSRDFSIIGFGYAFKIINYNNNLITLQIWDFEKQENWKAITKNYYKGSHGIILIYDVNNQETFEFIRNVISQIKEFDDESVKLVLVGNNYDNPNRVVNREDEEKLANDYNIGFFETSPKTGKNINEVFLFLTKEILNEINGNKEEAKKRIEIKLTKYLDF